MWRPDFPYVEERPAYIRDWSRRFWQGSTDHRGVPERPGRVVTLISRPGELCSGRAYRVEDRHRCGVLSQLDHREKGGYDRLATDIFFSDRNSTRGITYLATPDNEDYLGSAPSSEIVRQILTAHGPSGSNVEYVVKLHESLQDLNTADQHVEEIAVAVRLSLAIRNRAPRQPDR